MRAPRLRPPVPRQPREALRPGLWRVECHGDSTTRGVDPRCLRRVVAQAPIPVAMRCLRAAGLTDVRLRSHGRNGATAASLLGLGFPRRRRWCAHMAVRAPQAVVLSLGLNDACLETRLTSRRFAARMDRLIECARAVDSSVLVEVPNPVSRHGALGGVQKAWRLRKLVRALLALCRVREVPVCDQDAGVRRLPNWQHHLPDGVHPSAWLYRRKGEHLAQALMTHWPHKLSAKNDS